MSTQLWVGPLAGMTLHVEVAWGADLTDIDGSGWAWSDITADVRQAPGIDTKLGRGDEASRSQPASLTLTLDNTDGGYSLGGQSLNYPYVRRGAPVRVRVNPSDGAGPRVVFLGYADGWSPSWDAAGGVPTVELSASGTLRRLRQGQTPVISPLSRAFAALSSIVAYWPVEENDGATIIASGFPAGNDMVFNGTPKFGASTELTGASRAMDVGSGAFQASITPYTNTGSQQFRWMMEIPDGGLPDGTVLAHCHMYGTIGRIDITYELGPGPLFGVFRYNSDGTLNGSDLWNFSSVYSDGVPGRFSLEVKQVGSDVQWNIGWLPQTVGASLANSGFQTIAGKTCGTMFFVELTPHNDASGTIIGQVTVENTITNQFSDTPAIQAYYGELPTNSTGRAFRVCGENDVAFERLTDADPLEPTLPTREVMAYQPVAPLLDILYECEDADNAQLWDGRQPGLVFTTRRYRESGVVALTVDADAGELAPPFAAVDDDQRTVNLVTASRKFGSSATYEDVDGPMGTATIGRYDTGVTINLASDSMMEQEAGFRVALGTVTGYRTPTLTIDLRATPDLAGDVLDLVPGDRVQVVNPDDALASFPGQALDLLVEGVAHQVDANGWVATLTCSPATPWIPARLSSDIGDTSAFLLRGDTDGATLSASAARNSTTIGVATPSGPLWTTTADDYPLDLDVGGIKVHATACSGASSPQTFTVSPLTLDRTSGAAVALWDPRPLGL